MTFRQNFGFVGLTISSIVEFVVGVKLQLFPEFTGEYGHLKLAAIVFACNYLFGFLFWLVLYPNFFSPLRNIPGPRVGQLSFLAMTLLTDCSRLLVSPTRRSWSPSAPLATSLSTLPQSIRARTSST